MKQTKTKTHWLRALSGLALVAAVGCLDVAEERAEKDETVGQAQADGSRVTVAEGAAAVRALEAFSLHLWASVPAFAFTLEPVIGPITPWQIRIENVLPDAVLMATTRAGEPIAVRQVAAPFPTERSWLVEPTTVGPMDFVLRAPDADSREPFRFAAFADVQDAVDEVQDVFARMNADPTIRFAVMAGDLTEEGSVGQLERYQRELKQLVFPVFATLGNHELGREDTLYHKYHGRGNHQFSHRGVFFTALDSASATIAPVVYDWIDDWLIRAAASFHVVFMHIPPLDVAGIRNGAFASRNEGNMLVARLARGGVDLTVYGHIHSYYEYENADIPAYISGGGGAIPERFDGIGRHFLTIDVNPQTQTFQAAVVKVD